MPPLQSEKAGLDLNGGRHSLRLDLDLLPWIQPHAGADVRLPPQPEPADRVIAGQPGGEPDQELADIGGPEYEDLLEVPILGAPLPTVRRATSRPGAPFSGTSMWI